jgi:class 3 adenylate cyclase
MNANAPAERRAWRAYLATRCEELLAPVQASIDLAERMLAELTGDQRAEFADDMARVRRSALELRDLIHEVLSGSQPEASGARLETARSRLRHDMLNKLNPLINYSEMWLEEAQQSALARFAGDLRLLHGLGKRAFALVDTILASWNIESREAAPRPEEFEHLARLVERMECQKPQASSPPGRLLVVDDHDINRDILCRLLAAQGHQVLTAANGAQALELLRSEPVDLVLLDLVMPELDGFAVLDALKKDARLRELPVIMISALNEIEFVVRCIQLGAEDYLTRPYNPVFLKARVDACLEKLRLRERERQHLAEIERQRQRADELLHVILPAQIVAELKATNAVLPRRYDRVAVLFADIVDFTPYCERHPPEQVVAHLQRLVEFWEQAALRHEVQKIKTIGDAFMAACGLFTSVPNPVVNCLRLGEEMLGAVQRLPTGWTLRVGINFGQVVAGVLGNRQYLFDLFGDTVNTAARMESHGEPGAIILSGAAWREVAEFCDGQPLEAVPIKGKGPIARHRFTRFRTEVT